MTQNKQTIKCNHYSKIGLESTLVLGKCFICGKDIEKHDCENNIESNMCEAHCRICGKNNKTIEGWKSGIRKIKELGAPGNHDCGNNSNQTIDGVLKEFDETFSPEWWNGFGTTDDINKQGINGIKSFIQEKLQQSYEKGFIDGSDATGTQEEELKECSFCGTIKKSSPTPDGDEVCSSCGDREMMDYEQTARQENWEEKFSKRYGANDGTMCGITDEVIACIKVDILSKEREKAYEEGLNIRKNYNDPALLDQIRQEEREKIYKNICFLRQYLNEEKITDPKKIIDNADIEYWLDK